MRYFILSTPDALHIAPYVLAEVVRDTLDYDRRSSPAGALAGERAQIMTRAELRTEPAGRAALDAWDARDDSSFEEETSGLALLDDDGYTRPRLRVVRDDEDQAPRG